MKFNNELLIKLCCCMAVVLMAACTSVTEKTTGDSEKQAAAKKYPATDAEQAAKVSVQSSVLPAGPVTLNPYLQTKPKISEQAENNFRAATAAMQQKNWAQAESLLQTLATTQPMLSGVQLNLGIVQRAKGDSVKAEAAFNSALKINSKNIEAYNHLALLKRESGDFSAAESLYQKALHVWPFHPESHKNIAILYELYMGKSEQALPHYEAYQQLLVMPDKQVDSWIADLQRRLKGSKNDQTPTQKEEAT